MENKEKEKIDYSDISKNVEKTLRKSNWMSGTWVILGDGYKWCVPSMPLSKKRKLFLSMITEISKIQEKILTIEKEIQDLEDLQGDKKENSKELVEKTLELADEMLQKCLDMSIALLNINYPGLTEDIVYERDLITSQHAQLFMSIAKGETALGELLGNREEEFTKK